MPAAAQDLPQNAESPYTHDRLDAGSSPMTLLRRLTMLLATVLLAACGGGGGADGPAVQTQAVREWPAAVPNASGRGEFRGVTRLGVVPRADIAAAAAVPGSRTAGLVPRYAVTAYRLTYVTIDGQGREVVASGLVAVPDKPPGRMSPALLYQHGTIFKDAEAPSNAIAGGEGPIAAASLGYLVIAADYVGYGASRGTSQHPYLLSEPTAAAVIDLLRAAHHWHDTQGATAGVQCNGQVFLLGYSEGGYATMAAHRTLQATASPYLPHVVSTVAGSGPYHVGVTMDVLLRRIKDENLLLGALINPGFLRHLGESVRNEVRRQLVKALIPDDADVSFQTVFIDNFLADDEAAMDRMSNVHDWAPQRPMRMFHGRGDRTVPYRAAEVTLQAMLGRGASPALVSLTDCAVTPSDHLPCVEPFFTLATAHLATLARDL